MKRLVVLAALFSTALWATPASAGSLTIGMSNGSRAASAVFVNSGGQLVVTLTNTSTALVRTVTTASDGRYVLAAVPPGRYELRAEATGFKPHVRRDLDLTVAETLPLNITLQLGEFTIGNDLHRSESLALVQLLILYQLVTAKAAIALGGESARTGQVPAFRTRNAEVKQGLAAVGLPVRT